MPEINLHASCVVLAHAGPKLGAPEDAGILLLGESGSGKSDLALRLIAMGARLVADDRTLLWIEEGVLLGRAHPTLEGLIEVRGLGIRRLPTARQAAIRLAVILGREAERLPEPEYWPLPQGLDGASCPLLLRLNAFSASAPARIVLAAAQLGQLPDMGN
jgi:HPr kinase/phosphorylase